MANKYPWMPFYGDDFFNDVGLLPNEVIGAYIRLLWHQWKHEQLPMQLHRVCLAACWSVEDSQYKNFKELWTQLEPFFPRVEPGKRANPRCAKELMKRKALSEKRAIAGAKAHAKAPAIADTSHILHLKDLGTKSPDGTRDDSRPRARAREGQPTNRKNGTSTRSPQEEEKTLTRETKILREVRSILQEEGVGATERNLHNAVATWLNIHRSVSADDPGAVFRARVRKRDLTRFAEGDDEKAQRMIKDVGDV